MENYCSFLIFQSGQSFKSDPFDFPMKLYQHLEYAFFQPEVSDLKSIFCSADSRDICLHSTQRPKSVTTNLRERELVHFLSFSI